MRLAALILSILFGVSAISSVQAAPKKAIMDGLPLIMPSAVMFWMLHNKEMEAKEAAAKKASAPKAKAKPAKAAEKPKA